MQVVALRRDGGKRRQEAGESESSSFRRAISALLH
ncbi:hypothetical protein MLGJGCBP_03047 [Rhodococcus sp. T7]|nr:hypothetical protein MLGJGCBP_03047 [Rhodococcus sp. T7]